MLFYGKPYAEKTEFSLDNKYRYKRWIKWSDERTCVFVMRNPIGSTEEKLSMTVNKCMEIAKQNKCGGIINVNLCAYIAQNWNVLEAAKKNGINIEEEENGKNEKMLLSALNEQDALIIAAWGSKGKYLESQVETFKKLARNLNKSISCLGPSLLAGDQPRQPTARGISYSGLIKFPLD